MQTHLRYGKKRVSLNVPPNTHLLIGPEIPALPDAPAAVRDALQHPIGSQALGGLARNRKPQRVCITISDITRPVPNELVVGAILDELNAAGVPDAACDVLIATGMHRPSSPEERQQLLGDVLNRVRVTDHEAKRPETLGRVSDDPPVSVNRLYLDADLKIVTGLIEPHFMAGFSGGRKGVCPGLVDLPTIQRFHGYGFMSDPNSVEGRLIGNPCHDEALRMARLAGVDFLANVAITHHREVAGVYFGDFEQAFLRGCQDVAAWTAASFEQPFDLVVTCAGGYPLDQNFYQTVKGLCTALPAIAPSGTLLMLSACTEVGEPEYEQLYQQFGSDWRAFLDHIAQSGTTDKDQWEYQMQTRVLEHTGVERLVLANDGLPRETQQNLAVTPAPGEGDAVERTQEFITHFAEQNPEARIAVIPEGPYTMLTTPVLSSV